MMSKRSFIVLGGTGLIGSAVVAHLRRQGGDVLSVNSQNYQELVGQSADVLINCNGNTFRFKANQDPHWDFRASVESVERSLYDFRIGLYIYVSTIDVYPILNDPEQNSEDCPIDLGAIDPYGFHKRIAERLVEKYAPRSVVFRCGTAIGRGLKLCLKPFGPLAGGSQVDNVAHELAQR